MTAGYLLYRPLMRLDEGSRDPETEAGAAVLPTGGEERFENPASVPLANADPVVLEADPAGSFGCLKVHLDRRGFGLFRVLDEVCRDDLETFRGDAGLNTPLAGPRDDKPIAAVK